ncbi:MAG: hypothetical protein ABWZ26_05390 [Candidatus Nanopelagicales bacterium]
MSRLRLMAAAAGLLAVVGLATDASPAGAVTPTQDPSTEHVVVVGVPGLRWEDVSAAATPALWDVAERGSVGSLSVRSARARTCPGDGWVQLGTGNRARGPAPVRLVDGTVVCALLPPEQPEGDGAAVVGWADLVEANNDLLFDAVLGLMGDEVAVNTDGCVSAAGPGGAIGGADLSGRVPLWSPEVAGLGADDVAECPLTVLGSNALSDGVRTPDRMAMVDEVIATADRLRPPGSLLLVLGVSEVATERPQLHLAVAQGPGFTGGELTSATTRRAPFVQLSDVAPTVLEALGIDLPSEMPYQPWRSDDGDRQVDLADEVVRLQDFNLHAVRMGDLVPPFFLVIVLTQIVLYGGAYLVLRRVPDARVRGSVLIATQVVALLAAAGIVSTYVANLVPWWRAEQPLLVLLAAVAVSAGLIVGLAYAGPWRRHPFGPAGAVAVISVVIMTIDVVQGSQLQLSSLAGYSPIVAGRFVGFGNIAYAVFGTSALLATAAVVSGLGRRPTLVVVSAAGLLAVVLDGAPELGSDFGGVIALVPAFAVLGMLAAGIRLSWRRLALVLAAGVVAVAIVSTLDYLRSEADRTHLGRFVADVLDGDAWVVVQRKLEANLNLLQSSVLTWLVPVVIAFLWFLLRRPRGQLRRAFLVVPTLYAGLIAVLVLGVVGGLVNDSGVAVPAMAACVAIPLAVAVVVHVLRDDLRGGESAEAPDPADTVGARGRTGVFPA